MIRFIKPTEEPEKTKSIAQLRHELALRCMADLRKDLGITHDELLEALKSKIRAGHQG